MNINISEIVNNKISEMEKNKVVEKAIEDTIHKTVLSSITDALGDYKLKRIITEKIEKEVSQVVSKLGFTAYNTFIVNEVKKIMEGAVSEDLIIKIEKTFKDMLINKKENIKLSEICKEFKSYMCNYTDEEEQHELETFHISIKEEEEYGWINCVFSKEESEKYSSRDSVTFTIHRNYKEKNKGTLGCVYIDGNNIDKKTKFGYMNSFEILILNLVYNKTSVEIDVNSEHEVDCSFDID